jgi:hypothetical protein
VFTAAYPEPDQSSPYHLIIAISILSTQLRLGFHSCLFLSGFPINIVYAFRFSPHSCYMPCHPIPLDLILLIILGEEHKLWSSSNFLSLNPSSVHYIDFDESNFNSGSIKFQRHISDVLVKFSLC